MSTHVSKPWGREVILTNNSLPYTGKILFILAGKRISLQYHDQKTETLTLIGGQASLIVGPSINELKPVPMIISESITLSPGTIHRIEAQTDSVILEVSTPEAGTTFRLADDFNRPNETQDIRNSNNRGWQQ